MFYKMPFPSLNNCFRYFLFLFISLKRFVRYKKANYYIHQTCFAFLWFSTQSFHFLLYKKSPMLFLDWTGQVKVDLMFAKVFFLALVIYVFMLFYILKVYLDWVQKFLV